MNDIDWTETAPKLISDVADELMADRQSHQQSDTRISYGRRGSFVVDTRKGQFYDFESQVGGGLLDMIQHLLTVDKSDAYRWLKDNNYLDETYQPKVKERPKSHNAPSTDDNRYFDYGKRLWLESIPIPKNPSHPARRWAKHRNLLPPVLPFPDCIRYHEQNGYIISAMTTLRVWLSAERKANSFQVISIDDNGNKHYKFDNGMNDKRSFGKAGGASVIMLGDKHSETVNICEGLADGLAIYSRMGGIVLIAVTTIKKFDKPHIFEHLKDKKIVVWTDSDEAGYAAGQILMRSMYDAGMDVSYVDPIQGYKDPADAARRYPFIFNKDEYQRRVDMFKNRPEPERDAFILCYKNAQNQI